MADCDEAASADSSSGSLGAGRGAAHGAQLELEQGG
eukprot:CAMPEP_0171280392 /NCGR_PEP_ID=MMETSP0790-20130122/65871_1 /TAXON_ID=2925 /ORGANISM="Alexandrium catenella, Strain OF101" /LENGTH=35 /DNA_ID= /DNA_START= /DNA_END= /DNA_ORIENTATION=